MNEGVPETVSETHSVKVDDPEEKQTFCGCAAHSGDVSQIQNVSKVWTFLKKNAFAILTMAAVAVGKWSSYTLKTTFYLIKLAYYSFF